MESEIIVKADDGIETILHHVADYLEAYAKRHKNGVTRLSMWFRNAYDSNQTAFDKQCNDLYVGVLTDDKFTAGLLFALVKLFITHGEDDVWEAFYERIQHEGEKAAALQEMGFETSTVNPCDKLPISEFVKNFVGEAGYPSEHMSSLTSPFETESYGEVDDDEVAETVSTFRYFHEIDIWTLPRVIQYIHDNY